MDKKSDKKSDKNLDKTLRTTRDDVRQAIDLLEKGSIVSAAIKLHGLWISLDRILGTDETR